MTLQTGRDPFARHDVRRERVTDDRACCAWCGTIRTNKAGERYAYRYRVEPDSVGPSRYFYVADGRTFCGIQCCNAWLS